MTTTPITREERAELLAVMEGREPCLGASSPGVWQLALRYETALTAAEGEIERLEAALKQIEDGLGCGKNNGDHYCPSCDNSTFELRRIARAALEGEKK